MRNLRVGKGVTYSCPAINVAHVYACAGVSSVSVHMCSYMTDVCAGVNAHMCSLQYSCTVSPTAPSMSSMSRSVVAYRRENTTRQHPMRLVHAARSQHTVPPHALDRTVCVLALHRFPAPGAWCSVGIPHPNCAGACGVWHVRCCNMAVCIDVVPYPLWHILTSQAACWLVAAGCASEMQLDA